MMKLLRSEMRLQLCGGLIGLQLSEIAPQGELMERSVSEEGHLKENMQGVWVHDTCERTTVSLLASYW
jgi:hypothetical protein